MQRGTRAGLDVGPRRAAELGEDQVVLDVPLRGEDERLGAGGVGQPVEVLAGEAVQPGEPVGAGDGEHVAVAAVHQPRALGEQPLLPQRVAVVGGHRKAASAGSSTATAPGRDSRVELMGSPMLVRGTRGTSRTGRRAPRPR